MRRWLAWHGVFRLQECLKGHATIQFLREMEAADCLSADELEQLRRERLRQLIDYCYAHVPHVSQQFREAGIEPSQVHGVEDLVRLPLMTKGRHTQTSGEPAFGHCRKAFVIDYRRVDRRTSDFRYLETADGLAGRLPPAGCQVVGADGRRS